MVLDRSNRQGELAYKLIGWKDDPTERRFRGGIQNSRDFAHRIDAIFVGEHIDNQLHVLRGRTTNVRDRDQDSQRKGIRLLDPDLSENMRLNAEPRTIRLLNGGRGNSRVYFHRRSSPSRLFDRLLQIRRLGLGDFVHLIDGAPISFQREAHNDRLMLHHSELAGVNEVDRDSDQSASQSREGLNERWAIRPPIMRRGVLALAVTWVVFAIAPRTYDWRNRRRGRQVRIAAGVGLAASYILLFLTPWYISWSWWL
jgi:hypothetical protein